MNERLSQLKGCLRHLGRFAIHAAATITRGDRRFLSLARRCTLQGKPLAVRHLDHYLHGQGTPLTVDTSLLLAQDPGVHALFCGRVRAAVMGGRSSGEIPVPQWAFANRAWRYALGSVRVTWRERSGHVVARLRTRYAWAPDERRITQRLHQAAHRLQNEGAAEFELQGSPVVVPMSRIRDAAPAKTVPPRDRVYM